MLVRTLFLKADAKLAAGFLESGGVIFFSGIICELEWLLIDCIPSALISAKRAPARATARLRID